MSDTETTPIWRQALKDTNHPLYAAAWLLFYAAAHLMDSLEDRDDPDPWWQALGPSAAINIATGLYFRQPGCRVDLSVARQADHSAG
jgi:hypothetical protein